MCACSCDVAMTLSVHPFIYVCKLGGVLHASWSKGYAVTTGKESMTLCTLGADSTVRADTGKGSTPWGGIYKNTLRHWAREGKSTCACLKIKATLRWKRSKLSVNAEITTMSFSPLKPHLGQTSIEMVTKLEVFIEIILLLKLKQSD